MIRRVRMARKRLGIADERWQHAVQLADTAQWTNSTLKQRHIAYRREIRRNLTLRAIERRKDAIK